MRDSSERFWGRELAAPVESLVDGMGLMRRHVTVRAAIDAIPEEFPRLAAKLVWGRVEFISDMPGKNAGRGGGGLSTRALATLLGGAQQEVMQRYAALRARTQVFALRAKAMVVDRRVAYIGTYDLDPRSENLNTEVGVAIHDAGQAEAVAAAIETDPLLGNSWDAAADDPDQFASLGKRVRAWFWSWMPIRPLL